MPLYWIVDVAIQIGFGTLIKESPKFTLVLSVGVLNRDANPYRHRI